MLNYRKIKRLGWNDVVGNEERAVLLCFSGKDGGKVAVGTDAIAGMRRLKQPEKLALLCCPEWTKLVRVDQLSDAAVVEGQDGRPDYILVEEWELAKLPF